MSEQWVYTLPAARGIQAGRCFYNLAMPMRVLVKLLRIDDGDAMERSQRLVNPSRARKVAQYMLSNPESYIMGSCAHFSEKSKVSSQPFIYNG
ncbi:DNA sulfur modification protein DndB [Vibrio parahaemolyticus]|uniref:DNA sulfur modification protein DndB n=1 Tax=Vibrio parahaemolyticus TaxID=670 RepID=UPI0011229D8E|nr:DNA sulfur modification protein DndB [Vibrio parahaemolyticus]TOH16482.1 hypothetical protein CGI87_15750 [Vibrio parahaemolyticus]